MKRTFRNLGLLGLLLIHGIGCTKSDPPIVKQLQKSLSEAQQAVSDIDEAIKKVPETNQGLLLKLNQDKQLAISRFERIKENLMAVAPDKVPTGESGEGKQESGGHH